MVSKITLPAVGSSKRLMQRSSVLLPEPEGPMMKTSSRSATARSMPLRISAAPKLFLRPEMVSIAMRAASAVRCCRGRSVALWLTWRRVVARHTRHARPREDGDGGRAGGRLDPEPALVHAGNGAVLFHAFDGVLDLIEQLLGILAQRRGPNQPGRIKVGDLQLRLLLDGPLH